MPIKRKDFQKTSSTILEFLLKLPDEETSARLRDTLLHGLHFLQQYYLILQKRDKEQKPLQWTIERGLSPLTPFREAPDKFEWPWIDVESNKVKQTIPKHSLNNFLNLSPIIVAVREGDLRYVKELLNSEPELIDCVDSFGRDLLTYAVQYQQINILRYLLLECQPTANINVQANDGSTCLHRACYTNDGQQCNIEIVRILLENNADVTKQDVHLRSPLHWAVLAENIDCLKLLIEYNADVHIKDIDGMTPAMWSCHLDRYEHFKELSNHMSNTIEYDNDGRTWIHHSTRKTEPLKCLKHLLSSESILLCDNDGKNCLHIAAEQGSVHACRLIFETSEKENNFSYVSHGDKSRQTPLHIATKNGHARVLKELLDHGADPRLKDGQGISSIDYAQNRGLYFCRSVFEVYLREKTSQSRSSTTERFINNNSTKQNGVDMAPTPPVNGHATFIRRNGFRSSNDTPSSENHLTNEQYSQTKDYRNSSSNMQNKSNDDEKDINQTSLSNTNLAPPIKPRKVSTKSSNSMINLSQLRRNQNQSDDDDDDEQNSLEGHDNDSNSDDDNLFERQRSNSRFILRNGDERNSHQSNELNHLSQFKQSNKNLTYGDNRLFDEQISPNKSKQQIRLTINKDLLQPTTNRIGSANENNFALNRLKSNSSEAISTLDLTVAGQKFFRAKPQSDTFNTNSIRPPSGRLKPINSGKSTSHTDEYSASSMKTLEDVTNNVKQSASSTKTFLYKKKLSPLVNGSETLTKKYSYRPPIDQQQMIVDDVSSEETSSGGGNRDVKSINNNEKRSK